MNRDIRSIEDVLTMLDGFFTRGADWWDDFYADRDRPVPFFVDKPDESLVSYLDRCLIRPGRALDLGCGPGRNALYLAANGFTVDAVDLSPTAIAWGEERAREVDVRFLCGDAFALDLDGSYDLIYDSGCFHHLAPHRRVSYLDLLDRHLAVGGHLGFTGFASGVGEDVPTGSETPDAELYRKGTLEGGLAYTDEELRWIFAGLTEVELRLMNDEPDDSPNFGMPFLWTALFRKN